MTNDENIAKTVAKLRDCGRTSHYEHDQVGFTYRLNTVNAAIGRVQLRRLERWNNQRRAIAQRYDTLLADLDELVLPPPPNAISNPVYHLYVIRSQARDALKAWLEENGIQCGVHYQLPLHLQPIYRQLFDYAPGDFPKSELLCQTALSLPMFPTLKPAQVTYISEQIHEFFAQAPRASAYTTKLGGTVECGS